MKIAEPIPEPIWGDDVFMLFWVCLLGLQDGIFKFHDRNFGFQDWIFWIFWSPKIDFGNIWGYQNASKSCAAAFRDTSESRNCLTQCWFRSHFLLQASTDTVSHGLSSTSRCWRLLNKRDAHTISLATTTR